MDDKSKGPSLFKMEKNHFKMDTEEVFILQQLRSLFKNLRALSDGDRDYSLCTLSLMINSLFKSCEDIKKIPSVKKTLKTLYNKMVFFEGFVNDLRYETHHEVILYDFKINGETIPFLLYSELRVTPSFNVYQADPIHKSIQVTLEEDDCMKQKYCLRGKGFLRRVEEEKLIVDIDRAADLSLVGKKTR